MIKERLRLFRTAAQWLVAALSLMASVAGNASELNALRDFVSEANKDPASYAIIIRHALAPGTGDPPEFAIGACETQRNLDDTGRQQARVMGEKLKQAGLLKVEFHSSQWCRCVDTAELMREAWSDAAVTEVQELPAINSFFRRYEREAPQTAELKEWLSQRSSDTAVDSLAVLVTHQVNITALTNRFASSGEMVLLRINAAEPADGDVVEVLGSVEN